MKIKALEQRCFNKKMTQETFWYDRLWTKAAQNSADERELNIYAIVMHHFLTDPFIMNKKQTTAPPIVLH